MEKILNLKKALEDIGFEVDLYPNMEFVGRDMQTRRCIELEAYSGEEQEDGVIEGGMDITLIFHPDTYELLDDNSKCPLVE